MSYIDHIVFDETQQEIISRPIANSIADTYSSSKSYIIGDLVMYEGQLYRCKIAKNAGEWDSTKFEIYQIEDAIKDAIVVDNTLTVPGQAADAKKVGDEIADIKDDLSESVKFTEQNLMDAQKIQALTNIGAFGYGATSQHIIGSTVTVQYDFNDYNDEGVYQVYSSTAQHLNSPEHNSGLLLVTNGNYQVGTELKKGYLKQQIFISQQGNVYYRRRLPYNTANPNWGSWYSVTASVVSYNPQNRTPEQKVVALNNIGAFGYGSNVDYLYGAKDFNDYDKSGVYQVYHNSTVPHVNAPELNSGVLIVMTGDYTVNDDTHYEDYLIQQIFVSSNGKIYYRHKINRYVDAQWGVWNDILTPRISILFIGNSLTQDGVSYLGYLLKTYYPNISFKFYIWYNGGYSLQQNYEKFVNDTTCSIFSTAENSGSWTNENNSVTMNNILTTKTFDIVCMQPYMSFSEVDAEITGWNNCVDYIKSHYTGGNSLKFVSMFHAPRRNQIESDITKCKEISRRLLAETICEDVIPMGLAVYDALSTDLDSLGDQGHLSPDGTHTQEGLPCLLQTYVVAQWIFEKLAIPKSVYLSTLRMTTAIYNAINVPGPNLGTGVITGTDAQNILAQEVAIKAYKKGKELFDAPRNVVRFDEAQSLTNAQKTQAKTNIGVPIIDATLSIAGAAADAKAVGDKLENKKVTGFSIEAKDTLLKSLTHNLWLDDTGRDYYDSLYKALYGEMKYEWNRSYGLMEENGFICTSGTTELRSDGEYLNGTLVMPQYYSTNTKAYIDFTPFSGNGVFSIAIGGKGARIEYDANGVIKVMVANERVDVNDHTIVFNQRHSLRVEYLMSNMKFWLNDVLIYNSSSLSTSYANYTTIYSYDSVIHSVEYDVIEDLIYRWVPSDGQLLQNGFHHHVTSDKSSPQNLSKEKLQMLVGNGAGNIVLNKDIMDRYSSIDYVILMNAYDNRPCRAVFSLSNGAEGIRLYLNQKNINNSFISVYVMDGNTNTEISNVTLDLNKIYLVKLEYTSVGVKVYIGNNVIYESDTYSTAYVSAPTLACMGGELDLYSIRQRRVET